MTTVLLLLLLLVVVGAGDQMTTGLFSWATPLSLRNLMCVAV
jgi:hypothetical protein